MSLAHLDNKPSPTRIIFLGQISSLIDTYIRRALTKWLDRGGK